MLILLASAAVLSDERELRTPQSAKAEYFYLIVKLTTWPAETLVGNDGEFDLCLLGDDAALLEQLRRFEGETAHGREIVVRHFRRMRFGRGCTALFVARSERGELTRLIREMKGRPTLTVSDIDGFVERGGMIEIEQQGERITFMASPACARRAGLEIDARLLALAHNLAGMADDECP